MTAGNASKITDIALVKTGCSWIDSSVCSFSWGGGGGGGGAGGLFCSKPTHTQVVILQHHMRSPFI